PPRNSGSTPAASLLLPYDFVKSLGPYQLTTQATRLDCPALPPSPSKRLTPPVTPRNSARWPPAESPVTPIRSGSMWYLVALARSQRTAALQSWTAAGKGYLGARR